MRALLASLLLALTTSCVSTREPRQPLAPSEPALLTEFSYLDWGQVLERHVDDQGLVDYVGLAADRDSLDRFLARIAVVGPRTRADLFPTREDRLAYTINAYNACVIAEVLERWPLASVEDVKLDFFWLTRYPIDGEAISLYDLENDGIRAVFREPRVHFALNCASLGCPKLPREPFLGSRLEEQLARETARFLREERNVERASGNVLVLSQIFEWYDEDFSPSPLAWLRAQAPDLDLPTTATVRFRPWDWRINAQRLDPHDPR
jgi:hypothetical protein